MMSRLTKVSVLRMPGLVEISFSMKLESSSGDRILMMATSTTALFRDVFPEMPCPCFQALHWFSKAKLSLKKLGLVFQKLKEYIKPLLPAERPIFILDTTGVAFRGKVQKLSYLRGQRVKKAKGHARLCALIRYLQRERLLFIEGVEVGPGYASDVKLGLDVLENARGPGIH